LEALKLAFDTIIVGALALPWLVFLLDLFVAEAAGNKEYFWSSLSSVKAQIDKVPVAVSGIFLFAIAYFVGATVTRVSGDFFNDDDIVLSHARLPTEDNIRAEVYCDPEAQQPFADVPALRTLDLLPTLCDDAMAKKGRVTKNARDSIQQIFYVEEAALLQQGTDKTDRLNQLHSQLLVLRGATFDGLITLMLCLFGWGGQPQRWPSWYLLPIALVATGVLALIQHYGSKGLDDPPFMEYAWILLGLAGGFIVHKKRAPLRTAYRNGVVVSVVFCGFAYFGWWWSEVLYDQGVLYSFYAQNHDLSHAPSDASPTSDSGQTDP
jgi:hypothetical protein